jgi:hypothetical protein
MDKSADRVTMGLMFAGGRRRVRRSFQEAAWRR